MLDDFKKSIQLILNERITSPFSGAFFFSWFVWNWRLIYSLFHSDDTLPLQDRLNFVNTNFINLNNNLLFPLASTIFLVGLYPFVTTASLWTWLKFKKWQGDLKNKIEGQTLLTYDQSFALRLEVRNQGEKFSQVITAKDSELIAIQRENETLKKEITELRNQYDSSMKANKQKELMDLSEGELEILMLFANEPEGISKKVLQSTFSDASNLNNVKLDFYLGELTNKRLIVHGSSAALAYDGYKLTQEGRAYLVSKKVI